MRILDRYIIRSIIATFLLTLLAFSLLFVLIDSAANLDEFIDRKVTLGLLARYYAYYLPSFIGQIASIACLIACLLTYSRLNGGNEVIAMRASGLTFWRITRPALCFSLLIAALTFFVNERLIPYCQEKTKEIQNEHLILEVDRKKKKQAVIRNLTFYGLRRRLYFIESFDPNTYRMKGITIIGYDGHQRIKEKIIALEGTWTGIAWKFFNCQISTYPKKRGDRIKVTIYKEKLVDVKETPQDFLRQRLNVETMNIRQLRDYITRFADSGARGAINNLRVDLYAKYAFPFRVIVIVLVGLPLVLRSAHRRAQTFTALGVAVLIGFLYYVGVAVGLALGKGGMLSPVLAAWGTPALFFLVGLYLIHEHFA